jgi:hypothetical protein
LCSEGVYAFESAQHLHHKLLDYGSGGERPAIYGSSPSTSTKDKDLLSHSIGLIATDGQLPLRLLPQCWPLCGALLCIEHLDCPIKPPVERKSSAFPTDPTSTQHLPPSCTFHPNPLAPVIPAVPQNSVLNSSPRSPLLHRAPPPIGAYTAIFPVSHVLSRNVRVAAVKAGVPRVVRPHIH